MKNSILKIRILLYKALNKNEKVHELRLKLFKKLGIKYGENFRCFSNIIGNEPYLIEIGDNVTISTDVKFITHDNSAIKVIDNTTDIFGKIHIGNNCFIGINSLILPGVNISDNIIVGAGSVITKSFNEPNIIIAGNPAKKISTIEKYSENIKNFAVNTKGMSYIEKRDFIINNVTLITK